MSIECAVHDIAAGQLIVGEAGGAVLDQGGRVPVLTCDAEARHLIVAAASLETAQALLREGWRTPASACTTGRNNEHDGRTGFIG